MIRIIGEGSFGKVYLMRQRVERRLVCVKVIKIKNIPRKEREACKMEVDLLRRLNHPNIVGYKESFVHSNKEQVQLQLSGAGGCNRLLASMPRSFMNGLSARQKISFAS